MGQLWFIQYHFFVPHQMLPFSFNTITVSEFWSPSVKLVGSFSEHRNLTQILVKERRPKEQIYSELFYFSCI